MDSNHYIVKLLGNVTLGSPERWPLSWAHWVGFSYYQGTLRRVRSGFGTVTWTISMARPVNSSPSNAAAELRVVAGDGNLSAHRDWFVSGLCSDSPACHPNIPGYKAAASSKVSLGRGCTWWLSCVVVEHILLLLDNWHGGPIIGVRQGHFQHVSGHLLVLIDSGVTRGKWATSRGHPPGKGVLTPRVTAPRVTNPSDASGVHTYSQTLAAAAVEELHCVVGVPQDDDVIISRDCSASEKKASWVKTPGTCTAPSYSAQLIVRGPTRP